MERAESSIHNFIYSNNSSGVDIQRSNHSNGDNHSDRLGSSLETPAHQPVRPSSIPTGSSRSYSIGSSAAPGQSDSTGSSISSNTGLSHFLSSFNLWRASGPSSSDRQRAQSLSHMPDPALHNQSSTTTTNQSGDSSRPRYETEDSSSLSNPRAALTRLLSSRESRSGNHSGNTSSSATSAESQRRDGPFSVRDLTFAAAQEFLAEATLNGLGLGRVYVTHSLPSHMWAVNGNLLLVSFLFPCLLLLVIHIIIPGSVTGLRDEAIRRRVGRNKGIARALAP